MGHEGVAEVVAAGPAVSRISVGQRVIVPFQISCGSCERCRRGLTASCSAAPYGAMYGFEPFGGKWGGFLADLVRVPWADAMLVPLPAGLDPVAVASMSDNIPDAWRTVGPYLTDAASASVLIVGGAGPSVPFYPISIAKALGAGRVDYLDDDEERLAKAERLGANTLRHPQDVETLAYRLTVCTARGADALAVALRATEPDGICTCNSIFFEGDVPMPLLQMYTRGVRFVTGRVNARAVIPRVLELVAGGAFDPGDVTDLVVDWEDAADALAGHWAKIVVRRTA
jgi:alcohol dehydrogenase